MDFITISLQKYLQTVGLGFHTKSTENSNTSTTIKTIIADANISVYVIIDINPTTYSIKISVLPFLIIDSKNINNIRMMQEQWDEKNKLAKLNLNEEDYFGSSKGFSFQLCLNILSDTNGLTRTLWHKYFGRLFKEIAQVCHSVYNLKKVTDDIDILSI